MNEYRPVDEWSVVQLSGWWVVELNNGDPHRECASPHIVIVIARRTSTLRHVVAVCSRWPRWCTVTWLDDYCNALQSITLCLRWSRQLQLLNEHRPKSGSKYRWGDQWKSVWGQQIIVRSANDSYTENDPNQSISQLISCLSQWWKPAA